MIPQIKLKRGHEQRAKQGHPWIFAGEVERFSRGSFVPGDIVDVVTSGGERIGRGSINPHSQIMIRLLDRGFPEIDEVFFHRKIAHALQYRHAIGYEPSCTRIVSSEGDGLCGLIVDRYEDRLVIQALTHGIYNRLDWICAALVDLLKPSGIFLKNESAALEREGLPVEQRLLYGAWETPWNPQLDGIRLSLDIETAHKTGLFLDQTINRRMLGGYVAGKNVLDMFCYAGLWSLTAAQHHAASVVGMDISKDAIVHCQQSAALNGLSDICAFERRQVFEALKAMTHEGRQFDVIILDPPAFVKTKSKLQAALKGYEKLNRMALPLLRKPGLLVSCSCSYQVTGEVFRDLLMQTLHRSGCRGKLLHALSQAPDHPILLNVPETQYLKCYYLWVE